jgi:hypothetical protein
MEHVEPRRAEGMQKADVYFWSKRTGLIELQGVMYDAQVNQQSTEDFYTTTRDELPIKAIKSCVIFIQGDSPEHQARVDQLVLACQIRTRGLLWAVVADRASLPMDMIPCLLWTVDASEQKAEFRSCGPFMVTSDKGRQAAHGA